MSMRLRCRILCGGSRFVGFVRGWIYLLRRWCRSKRFRPRRQGRRCWGRRGADRERGNLSLGLLAWRRVGCRCCFLWCKRLDGHRDRRLGGMCRGGG